jgi:hypothetical protein
MNEVSCKVFSFKLRALQAKGVPLDVLVEGTSIPLTKLQNKKERIDWEDYAAVMRNARKYFSDEEYVELGRSYLHNPGLKFALVAARLLFSAKDFYRWMNKPRDGIGNQMFTCIVPSHREISETEIQIDLMLDEGYEMVWDFFVITLGNMEELPKLLGGPRAHVELTRLERGARYRVSIPKGVPLLTRVRRWLTWPFTVRAAARELKDAHESLLEQ